MKTIANAPFFESAPQIYKMIEAAEEYFKSLNLESIKQKYAEKKDEEGNAKKYILEIAKKMLYEMPEQTSVLLGMAAFKSQDECKELTTPEVFEIFTSITGCKEIMDFFISMVRLGAGDSENTSQK